MNEEIVITYDDMPRDALIQLVEDFVNEFDDHIDRVRDVLDKNDVDYYVVTGDV